MTPEEKWERNLAHPLHSQLFRYELLQMVRKKVCRRATRRTRKQLTVGSATMSFSLQICRLCGRCEGMDEPPPEPDNAGQGELGL